MGHMGSYFTIPKAKFYLLKGTIELRVKGLQLLLQGLALGADILGH